MNTFNFNRLASPIISQWDSEPFQGDELARAELFSFPTRKERTQDTFKADDIGFLCFGGNDVIEPSSPGLMPVTPFAGDQCFNIKALPLRPNFKDVTSKDIKAAEISEEEECLKPTKKISKAKSVRAKKKRRKNSKAKSVKILLMKKRLDSIETCSSLSNSGDSSKMVEEEENLNFKPIIKLDVNRTFKLKSRGIKSNIPQIFNSSLFSNSNSNKIEELSNCFINSTLLKKRAEKKNSQVQSVTSVLGQLKIFKESNLEAGSYMASLETTIESINKMKNFM